MIVGVPKEIKDNEYRVSLVPAGVEELVVQGHDVWVEARAGEGSGIADHMFKKAGARIVQSHALIFQKAELVLKVKEPQPEEYHWLKPGQVVFGYFHFAASRTLTQAMIQARIVAIAYETIRLPNGEHPLLIPMSEVAGKMAVQEGAKYLERSMGGRGLLLGGVTGVQPAKVVVLGAGTVGTQAARMAASLGAQVILMDHNLARLRLLETTLPENVVLLVSNRSTIREQVLEADLLIGSIYVDAEKAPRLVSKELVQQMKPRSVIVDVAIDQGGCIETSRPTTHSHPVYEKFKVIHYCVTNIPGAVGMTSTYALTNATLPFVLKIAQDGYKVAMQKDPVLATGLNLEWGEIKHPVLQKIFEKRSK